MRGFKLGNSSRSSITALSALLVIAAQSSTDEPNLSPNNYRALSHFDAKIVRALIFLSAKSSLTLRSEFSAISRVFCAVRSGPFLPQALGYKTAEFEAELLVLPGPARLGLGTGLMGPAMVWPMNETGPGGPSTEAVLLTELMLRSGVGRIPKTSPG